MDITSLNARGVRVQDANHNLFIHSVRSIVHGTEWAILQTEEVSDFGKSCPQGRIEILGRQDGDCGWRDRSHR